MLLFSELDDELKWIEVFVLNVYYNRYRLMIFRELRLVILE